MNGQQYDFLFVDQIGFEKHTPKSFAAVVASFIEYRRLLKKYGITFDERYVWD